VGCEEKRHCRKILTSAFFFNDKIVPRWHLANCKSRLDWILSALSRQPSLHKTFQTALQTKEPAANLFSVHLYDPPQLEKISALLQSSSQVKIINHKSSIINPGELTRLKDALNWQYSFVDAPLLPAKRTVTQWTHRNDEFAKMDHSLSLNRRPKAILAAEQVDSVDGRMVGAATHLVISRLDLVKPITAEAITRLIEKLVADGAFNQPVASQINAESIAQFFKSELGLTTLDKNNSISREWPFTFAVPASQWLQSGHCEAFTLSEVEGKGRSNLASHEPRSPWRSFASAKRATSIEHQASSNDFIIVQGIIDLLIKTPEGLVVIDFKTDLSSVALAKSDAISPDEITKRAELYRQQLDLYAQAASNIIGQKVCGKYLYFLRPGREVEV
jgi:ATP-dependent helicase/nuclease subunit A